MTSFFSWMVVGGCGEGAGCIAGEKSRGSEVSFFVCISECKKHLTQQKSTGPYYSVESPSGG